MIIRYVDKFGERHHVDVAYLVVNCLFALWRAWRHPVITPSEWEELRRAVDRPWEEIG